MKTDPALSMRELTLIFPGRNLNQRIMSFRTTMGSPAMNRISLSTVTSIHLTHPRLPSLLATTRSTSRVKRSRNGFACRYPTIFPSRRITTNSMAHPAHPSMTGTAFTIFVGKQGNRCLMRTIRPTAIQFARVQEMNHRRHAACRRRYRRLHGQL